MIESVILSNELVFSFNQLNYFEISILSVLDPHHHLKNIENEKFIVIVDYPITTDPINMIIKMKKNS